MAVKRASRPGILRSRFHRSTPQYSHSRLRLRGANEQASYAPPIPCPWYFPARDRRLFANEPSPCHSTVACHGNVISSIGDDIVRDLTPRSREIGRASCRERGCQNVLI